MGQAIGKAYEPDYTANQATCASAQSLDKERLRILRCTARAMANSPGGLSFVAGTKPWLEGLPGGRPRSAYGGARPQDGASPTPQ